MPAILRIFAAFLIAALVAVPAAAHEVRPAIADITLGEADARLEIRLNLEALIAGIDLDGLEDTDTAANAPDYDRLRAMGAAELGDALDRFWPTMRNGFQIRVDGATVSPDLIATGIPDVGNAALPRDSIVTLSVPAGRELIFGWQRSFGDIIVRQQGVPEEAAFTGLLSGGEASPVMTADGGASEGALATFVRYIGVGFDHIVPKGLDHILFVLGLFFLAPRVMPLLWQVSAFTLAHTVTLALGATGVVRVDPGIVEPLIALSIVYVAVENILVRELGPWRPALIFCFGLLHGLGFASVLDEFGLPAGQFVPALIGFNVGVEVGQLAVIAVAFALVGYWFRDRSWYRARISVPASVVIAAVGAFWVVERTIL